MLLELFVGLGRAVSPLLPPGGQSRHHGCCTVKSCTSLLAAGWNDKTVLAAGES